ncbi:MAG TPA: GNAT family N-acetyltransferase [Gaiellaceae bacterium]|nr:GNAT family N-acetyltransferase [Gaiellaceae bacterium]
MTGTSARSFAVRLSPLEETRFGVRAARADDVTAGDIDALLAFGRQHGVQLIIARVDVEELRAAQLLEDAGFRLMDTLVYQVRAVRERELPHDEPRGLIRPLRAGEEEAVRAVAAEAFQGYFGHYHADERLPAEAADATYIDWAVRSCTEPGVCDAVYAADLDGEVVGFITYRLLSPDDAEIVLGGVLRHARRLGIYRSFLVHGMAWARERGAARVIVSTQITNVAVQKVWARLGFEPTHAYYTFHGWLE